MTTDKIQVTEDGDAGAPATDRKVDTKPEL